MQMVSSSWRVTDEWFGNLAVIGFMLVQYLDGFYTYAGFAIWGLNVEANPLIRSAVGMVGPGTGLAVAKLVAIGFGMLLHLRGVHVAVAILTGVYVVMSIVPWTALLFLS
jgi:hypothetical protein